MQSSLFTILLFGMSLSIPVALADGITIPDREHRKGMSYEEYSSFREKMRQQMESRNADAPRRTTNDEGGNPADQAEKSQRDKAYGQGYHSRTAPEDRSPPRADSKPERPRADRFNRGDMGRR